MLAQLVEEDEGALLLLVVACVVVIVGGAIDIELVVIVIIKAEMGVQTVDTLVAVPVGVELSCVLRGRLAGKNGAHSVGILRACCWLRAHAARKALKNSGSVSKYT
jgi:hypothetical protein